MRTTKNKFTAILSLFAITTLLFLGCSKKNDDNPSGSPKKVVFKAETSAGSSVNMAVYGYDATLTTASSLSGSTWSSPEITVPANANLASITANGIGSNASATLKVQIYVNGELKKEGTSSGTALSAIAQYSLK